MVKKVDGAERPGNSLAPGARTIRMCPLDGRSRNPPVAPLEQVAAAEGCSLDARSKGQSGHPSKLDLGRAVEASTARDHPSHPVKRSELRPRLGKGCVLARLGWAGETKAFLTILQGALRSPTAYADFPCERSPQWSFNSNLLVTT